MIVAVDRQKLAWFLNENCSATILHKIVLFENTSPLWAETTREKEE